MKKLIVFYFAFALPLFPTIIFAENNWAHEIDFGMVMYKGNTDAKNFNGKVLSHFQYRKISNDVELSGLLAIGKNSTTFLRERNAEKYNLKEKVEYHFTPRHFSFLNAEGTRDHFSAFDYEITESIGYGYLFVDTKQVKMNIQGGPGGRHSKTRSPQTYQDEWIGHLESKLTYLFNPQTSFSQKITSDASEKNIKTRSVSELKTSLIEPLAVKLSLNLENNSHVPETDDKRIYKTDTTTAISISYTF